MKQKPESAFLNGPPRRWQIQMFIKGRRKAGLTLKASRKKAIPIGEILAGLGGRMRALRQGKMSWKRRDPRREQATQRQMMIEVKMAEINKLSVDKALKKLRADDPPKPKNARLDYKMDVLNEESKRIRAEIAPRSAAA